jgi:UDP-N-acetylmuramoyl-L-alanyl-D-glutamate--2,6-diaminopimelate ligase
VAVPSVGGGLWSGGIRHVPEAVERGAVAIVAQAAPMSGDIPTVWVPDARRALAELSAAFYAHPSEHLSVYGVTGTDGKTTTTYLLDQIFRAVGKDTGLIGTVDIKIGTEHLANLERTTTPESLDLQRLLRRMVDAGVTHVALEASSHGLALDRLRGCRFAACGLTNITADHIEFHGSWEEYFAAKASLFSDLGAGVPAILNAEDKHFTRLAEIIPGPISTYGFSPGCDVHAAAVTATSEGSHFTVRVGGRELSAFLPQPGKYNISNALAATALALSAGLSLEAIVEALLHANPPPGRLQRVEAGQEYAVFVDYAHTVHAFRTVLTTLRERTPPPGRLIVVFGAAGDRDRAKRPVLARLAREYADFSIITNEDPCSEDPDAIIEQIAAGLPSEEEGSRFVRELDRACAIKQGLNRARPGDTVVILGKGHEQSIEANGDKQAWSDVSVVLELLEGVR